MRTRCRIWFAARPSFRITSPHPLIVFLDAPIVLSPADLQFFGTKNLDPSQKEASTDDETLVPRAWWRANDTNTKYLGFQETLNYIRDFLASQERPFQVCVRNITQLTVVYNGVSPEQGILGFSQGSGMAALLASLVRSVTVLQDSAHWTTARTTHRGRQI